MSFILEAFYKVSFFISRLHIFHVLRKTEKSKSWGITRMFKDRWYRKFNLHESRNWASWTCTAETFYGFWTIPEYLCTE